MTFEETKPVSIKKFDFLSGADTSVSAEDGGNGFTGQGWKTNNMVSVCGIENAFKGGRFCFGINELPPSIRIYGKGTNYEINRIIGSLLFESLLIEDPVNLSLSPSLATHWKIDRDSVTFYFRINPEARWADGMPVTTDDVIATIKFISNPNLLSPAISDFINTFEQPIKISKYIFSIKSKENDWRKIYYLSSLFIMPEHILKNITANDYLNQYQYKYMIGSGPYLILDEDIKKGESITLRRRVDYWAKDVYYNTGKYNFDEIKFTCIPDDNLLFEKFKKGDVDYYGIRNNYILRTGFDIDFAKRNLIVTKRVFNYEPLGISGLILNMRREPFNDIRIRKSFYYLFDREKINNKLFDTLYTLYNSFFPNTEYANPSNPVIHFNLDSAISLLNSAGWYLNNKTGMLEKNGKTFEVQIPITKSDEKYLTVYQEDLKKAGIKLNLKLVDEMTLMTLGGERNFDIIPISWTGLLIENPETFLGKKSSRQKYSNNWSGIEDNRLDSLFIIYKHTYSRSEQISILKEIDKIAYSYFAFIDGFSRLYKTFAFQNKFSYPECLIGKYERLKFILSYWSIDPEKYSLYKRAMEDKSVSLPSEEFINNYWRDNRTN
jgi:microcin C transport system substrate-binding protein